jgi:hypothetical protein
MGASVAASSPPTAAVGGGISLRPATPDPATPTYFTIKAKAGTTVDETVIISNHATTPVDLVVSPVDGLTGQTSGSVYANREDPVRKAGKWVTSSLTSFELAANSERPVGFTVTIPADATAGDHLAGFAVENTQPTSSSNGFAIRQIVRNVIGVLVVVPGPAAFVPHLSSLGIQQVGSTGIGAVDVGLANTGNLLAKPELTVTLADTKSAGYRRTLTRDLDTVLPGDAITYPFTWPDSLKKGDYDITATLTGGGKRVSMHRAFTLGTVLAGVNQPLPKAAAHAAKKSGLQLWQVIVVVLAAALVFGAVTGTIVSRGRKRSTAVRQV